MAGRPIQLSKRSNPLYDDTIDLWNLYFNSVRGGLHFANDANIFSHRLEDSDDYEERLTRAYYLNFCDTVPNIYNSYIFKENIVRATDETLKDFRTNVDRRGTSISDFVKRCGYFASVFGVIHVLLDMPESTKATPSIADVKANKLYPYCTIVYPTQIKDWSLDRNGNYKWILIEEEYYRDDDPTMERQIETHYRLITTKDWRIEDKDGKPVSFDDGTKAAGTNTLGLIPIATMYHKDIVDNKIGESLIKDIVYVNRTILNWCSCIDEQIERQTFSQLVVPDDGTIAEGNEKGEDPIYRISTSSVWTFNADSTHPPQFISPNVQNIETVWNLVIDHIKEIYRMAGLIGVSEDMYVSKSGRSAQMGFMGVNSSLAEKASRYQKFENDISKIAYLYMGKNVEEFEEVRYPTAFDIAALADEIDSLFKLMGKNFSVTLNKTIQKDLARKAVPVAPHSIRVQIENEIESGSGIVESDIAKESKPFDDGSGNPNVQGISNTFKTKGQKED
jgi:hypothetical protein